MNRISRTAVFAALLLSAVLVACQSKLPASLPTDPAGNVEPTYEGMADTCSMPANGACTGCSVKCWPKVQVAICRPSVETPPWTIADPSKRVACFQPATCECR